MKGFESVVMEWKFIYDVVSTAMNRFKPLFKWRRAMYDDLIKLSKNVSYERRTLDSVVCNGPAVVFAVTLTSDQAGVADAIVYDGNGTSGDIKFDLACIDDSHDHRPFYPGVYFRRGIYIDIGSNVESVCIQFLPIAE